MLMATSPRGIVPSCITRKVDVIGRLSPLRRKAQTSHTPPPRCHAWWCTDAHEEHHARGQRPHGLHDHECHLGM